MRELTPEELEEHDRLVELESTPEAIAAGRAQARELNRAIEEDSVCGELRRAICRSRLGIYDLGERCGIEPGRLSDFNGGNAPLTSDEFSRLCAELGLRLRPAD